MRDQLRHAKHFLTLFLFIFLSVFPVIPSLPSGLNVFGPEKFVRTTGPTNIYFRTFTAPPNTTSPYILHIVNGNPKANSQREAKRSRVSSGRILINGKEVVSPKELSKQISEINKSVNLGRNTLKLEVRLDSEPGSYLTLAILGNRTNHAPMADGGPDQTVFVRQTVTLDGSRSTDAEGDLLRFQWRFVSVPSGSLAMLSDPTAVKPTFVADLAGDYVVKLIVNDGKVDSASDLVTITTQNSPPVANAGPDQTVARGATVTLDGSGSQDADGSRLTFKWSVLSRPAGSNAVLSDPTAVKPTFVADIPGSYVAQLIVNDGTFDSAPDTVTMTTLNSPPVAEAGLDQTVIVSTTVTLDGSGSSDVDGDLLAFRWSFISLPVGSNAALSDPTAVKPAFVPDIPGSYVAQLIVDDGTFDSAPDTVAITTQNSPPVAHAGADQTVSVGTTVTLNGSGTSDVDGDFLIYAWSFVSIPTGGKATLTDPHGPMTTFIVDRPGTYVVQLIVNDGKVNSDPDTAVITTANSPPVADAGPDQQVAEGNTVILDGSSSSDVDFDLLTYQWSFTSKPTGSVVGLSDLGAAKPFFVADLAGTYVAQLIVNDGKVNSEPDTVTMTVKAVPVAIDDTYHLAENSLLNIPLPGILTNDQDADGDPLTALLMTGPANGILTLNPDGSFIYTPDAHFNGTDRFTYRAKDSFQESNTAMVTLIVDPVNHAPLADAGSDQTLVREQTTVLDGSSSSDPDGNPLTYRWSLLSRPTESAAVLSNSISASPSLMMDVPGEYVAQLIVNDGTTDSIPDTVHVTFSTWIKVRVTSPLNGDLIQTSPMTVNGMVNDPHAIVIVNGIAASVASDGSFSAPSVPLMEGMNPVTAEAVNPFGQTDNDTVAVSYQPKPISLNVAILAPFDGSAIESSRFNVAGTVNDPSATVLVNDTLAAVEEGLFKATVFTCALPGPLPTQEGSEPDVCTITVTAYAQNGQVATDTLTYTHSPSEAPFTVRITEPPAEKLITYSPVEIKGTINDILSGFSPTAVTVNGITAIVHAGAFSALVPLDDGINPITVHAENLVGSDAYDTTRIIYEPLDKPLSVLVTAPVVPFLVNHAPIMVSGDVNDSSAAVDVNGIPADQDFRSFKVSLPLSIGANTLSVTATRPNGESVTSTLQVTYDPDAPSPPPPVLSPLPKQMKLLFTESAGGRLQYNGLDVSGLTSPRYHIEVVVNGFVYPPVQADSDGLFKTTVLLPTDGPYHLSARAIDLSGNTSALSEEQVVIKDTLKPKVDAALHQRRIGLAATQVEINGFTEPFAAVSIDIYPDPGPHHLIADERGYFSATTHLNGGEHFVSITAKDEAGNIGRNTRVFYTVHPGWLSAPMPPMIDPLPSPTNATRILVEGNAYSHGHIELYRNNQLIGTVVANERGRFRFEGVLLSPGTHILKVRQKQLQAFRHGGLLFFEPPDRFLDPVDSAEVVIEVITGTPASPQVNITFPADGAVTDAEYLPLRGSISDPNAFIRVSPTYTLEGSAQNLGDTFVSEWKIPLIPGENVLWVEAVSADGSRGVDKVRVFSRKDAAVPSVRLIRPVENEAIFEQFIMAAGEVDPSVQTVIVNEVEAIAAGGRFTADFLNLAGRYGADSRHEGKVLITAWAIDDRGRIGEDQIAVGYRDLPIPEVYVSTPLDGEIVTASSITLTGEVYDAAEVTVNGRSAPIVGNAFSIPLDLAEGKNTIVVIAKNAAKGAVQTLSVHSQPSLTLTSLLIEEAKTVIPLGGAFPLRAVGVRGDGSRMDLTQSVVWNSSAPTVAAVNNRGFVTGLAGGKTTLSARFNGMTAQSDLIVGSATLQEIQIAHKEVFLLVSLEPQLTLASPTLEVGETLPLIAFGVYSDGSGVSFGNGVNPPATWASSDPNIASIDLFGRLTAVRFGTAQITASDAGAVGQTTVTVLPPPMFLFIADPLTETATESTQITVRGRVMTEAPAVEVRVNGISAQVTADQFVAAGVPLTLGNNTITAEATDSNGVTAAFEISVKSFPLPPIQLFITDPAGGSTTTRDEVTVQGIVLSQSPEVGVTVNGVLAQVSGNRFVANGVRLTPGTNILTVQAVDSNGLIAASEATVRSHPVANSITLRSNIESGIAPLEITLKIESSFGDFPSSTLSFSGPATPQITPVGAEEYRVNLTTDGIYSLTATVAGAEGQTFSDTIVITVFNAIQMENLLNQKWEEMRAALSSGEIETALTYFTPHAGQKYRSVFEALRSNLPSIAGALQPIRLTDLQGNVAECFTNRVEEGVLNAYFVYFILDSNGFWKLVAM